MIARLIPSLVAVFALSGIPLAFARSPVEFKEVSRILGQRCLHCHNDIDQDGGLSVETWESMQDSGYVQPGNSTDSELIVAISGDHTGSPSMPKDGEPLTDEEVGLIAQWIDAGAPWPSGERISDAIGDFKWWSYRDLERPPVPRIHTPWVRTPIDAFIASKHRDLGLTPGIAADRRTLIRRLTYDLIGLPPTQDQIDTFVSDQSATAYEDLVERLLASQHYGERWARHWLDVVKYADTCGYDKDKLRPNAWPYRDYVIRSFNDDKPYSRFVQEQVAGDALYPGEPDGVVGLGFLAAGPWDFIGHVEVAESKLDGKVARNLDRDEMVSNTMNTFCSVTVQCARCHNHKFDPITQEHYYSMQALFAALDRAERPYDADPQLANRRTQLHHQLQETQQQLAMLDREISEAGGSRLVDFDRQIRDLKSRLGVRKSPAFGYHSQIAPSKEETKWVEIDLGRTVTIDRVVLNAAHDDFAGIGAGFGFPIRYRLDLIQDSGTTHSVTTIYESSVDEPNPGLKPIRVMADHTDARIIRLTATHLAERKKDYIFAIAELQVLDTDGNNVAAGAEVRAMDSIEALPRWGKSNLVDSDWATNADPKIQRDLEAMTEQRNQLWNELNTPSRKTRRQTLTERAERIRAQIDALPDAATVYAATTDFQPQGNFKPTRGQPRAISILHRGDIQQPLRTVGSGMIPLSDRDQWRIDAQSEADGRAQLATWLTERDHPLVWRSIVNRIWQYHFGEGIVSTSNDFGQMGERPSNQALLDWLAVEFRDGGQSFKQLHRLIVTSSVYRQSSASHERNLTIDSDNRYLWRMNRRRLTAEEIRDSILAVSGSLDPKMGGPGFYLFQLEKTQHSPHYEYHKFDPADPQSHRRSIYRFVVRSQPDPFMTTLDCADSSQSTPKRIETLTSLQALSLLNNRFSLEMSERFSDRLQEIDKSLEEQVNHGFRLITGREPESTETAELTEYARRHGLPNLCRVLFNLSEFVFID